MQPDTTTPSTSWAAGAPGGPGVTSPEIAGGPLAPELVLINSVDPVTAIYLKAACDWYLLNFGLEDEDAYGAYPTWAPVVRPSTTIAIPVVVYCWFLCADGIWRLLPARPILTPHSTFIAVRLSMSEPQGRTVANQTYAQLLHEFVADDLPFWPRLKSVWCRVCGKHRNDAIHSTERDRNAK